MALTPGQFANETRGWPKKIYSNLRNALNSEASVLIGLLQSRSPVDTGEYRGNWRVVRSRFATRNAIAGIAISNRSPHAVFMEEGAPLGKPPWWSATGKPDSKKKKKRSGKLIHAKGRLWAGGKNPGFGQTVGGAFPAIKNRKDVQDRLTLSIANSIIGAIK